MTAEVRVGIDAWGLSGPAARTGMGQYAAALLRWLPVLGGVEVVAYGAPGEPRPPWLSYAVEWRTPGSERFGKLAGIHSRAVAFPAAVASDGCEVFHSPAVHVRPSFPPVARVNCPRIVTIHDVIPLSYYRRALPPRARAFYRWNLGRAASADRILTVSGQARSEIAAHARIPASRIEVVSSAVDFEPNHDPGARLALQLDTPYVLYAGSYEPRKNLLGTLLAFEQYVAAGGPCSLVAVTEAESGHAAAVHAVLNGLACRERVQFVHDLSQPDLRALYTAAEAVVFPSLAEGLGLPPIQAAACGVPVVISDLAVLRETVGAVAVVAEPSDPAKLCAAIARATTDPAVRARSASEGPLIAARFHPRQSAQAHADIYRACKERRDAPV